MYQTFLKWKQQVEEWYIGYDVICGGGGLVSRVGLFATPWTVAQQAPLSLGFSRQEY